MHHREIDKVWELFVLFVCVREREQIRRPRRMVEVARERDLFSFQVKYENIFTVGLNSYECFDFDTAAQYTQSQKGI